MTMITPSYLGETIEYSSLSPTVSLLRSHLPAFGVWLTSVTF